MGARLKAPRLNIINDHSATSTEHTCIDLSCESISHTSSTLRNRPSSFPGFECKMQTSRPKLQNRNFNIMMPTFVCNLFLKAMLTQLAIYKLQPMLRSQSNRQQPKLVPPLPLPRVGGRASVLGGQEQTAGPGKIIAMLILSAS